MPFARLISHRLVWRVKDAYAYGSRLLTLQPSQLPSSLSSGAHHRLLSSGDTAAAVIPPPTFEGEAKTYAPKIQKLVSEISQLTLVEVADLNELLKKTLKLPDAPAMMYASGASPAAKPADEEVAEAPVKQEKTTFTVRLIKFDDAKKVAVIKEIKNLVAGMNLVQAKKFVESVPQTVKSDVSKDEAEKLKATLIAAGGMVEVD